MYDFFHNFTARRSKGDWPVIASKGRVILFINGNIISRSPYTGNITINKKSVQTNYDKRLASSFAIVFRNIGAMFSGPGEESCFKPFKILQNNSRVAQNTISSKFEVRENLVIYCKNRTKIFIECLSLVCFVSAKGSII